MKATCVEAVSDLRIVNPLSVDEDAFKDNVEHLEALEYEGRLRLAIACLRRANNFSQATAIKGGLPMGVGKRDLSDLPDLTSLGLGPEKADPEELEALLVRIEEDSGRKARNASLKGIELNLERCCATYELDPFERIVLSLLISNNTSRAFRDFYRKSEIDPHDRQDGGMSIGAILIHHSPGL